jgi:cobyrinic acid a,c-diamide synthase
MKFMSQSISHYKISHWTLRVIVLVSLADMALAEMSQGYYRAFGRSLNQIISSWHLASTLLLPMYVLVEAWWMRNSLQERKAIVIDGIFVVVWFVTLWGGILYKLVTSVWL